MLPTLHQIINTSETADQRAVKELPDKLSEFIFKILLLWKSSKKVDDILSLSSKSEVLKTIISKMNVLYIILTEFI